MSTNKYEEVGKEIRRKLIADAVGCIAYVAGGSVMKREMAEKYGMSESEVLPFLREISRDLIESINRL